MPVRTYSSGMSMRLAFAVASHVNPDVLLLDEVLAVGDEAFQRKCFGRIFEFRRGGGHPGVRLARPRGRGARLRPGRPAGERRRGRRGRPPRTSSPPTTACSPDGAGAAGTRREAPTRTARVWGNREVDHPRRAARRRGRPERPLRERRAAHDRDGGRGRAARSRRPIFGIGVSSVDGRPLLRDQHAARLARGRRNSRGARRVSFTIPAPAAARRAASRCSSRWCSYDESDGLPLARPLAGVQRLPAGHGRGAGEHERPLDRASRGPGAAVRRGGAAGRPADGRVVG